MGSTVGPGWHEPNALEIVQAIGLGLYEPSEDELRRWRLVADIHTLRQNPDSVLRHEVPPRWQIALLAVALAGFLLIFVR